jgi:hypothetical protein
MNPMILNTPALLGADALAQGGRTGKYPDGGLCVKEKKTHLPAERRCGSPSRMLDFSNS